MRRRHEAVPAVLVVVAVGAAVWVCAWALANASYDTVVGCAIGGVLAWIAWVAGAAIARREPDPAIARILRWAPLVKLSMAIPRYAMAFVLYDGSADAGVYHDEGIRLREFYVEGILNADLGRPFLGTGSVRALTGLLYTVTGPTLLGAFFLFSFVGFWGLYFFYRAFCVAVPEGDQRRYAILVLFLPSLLFWPSSLGKEAWVTLGLGLLAYGSARLLARLRHGFPIVVAGLLTAGMVRPHVAAMVVMGLLGAYVTRRSPAGDSVLAPARKLVGLLVLGAILFFAVGQVSSYLGVDSFNRDAVEAARAEVVQQTQQGGSVFSNTETDLDPSELHVALASVLFRPFPWETNNVQSLVAATEGLLLVGLVYTSRRRLLGAVRSFLRTPYVVLCTVYVVLFTYGFSSFANFGILTRQRVQVLPFFLVLLCLPAFAGGRRELRQLLTTAPTAS
jgi:hypothetical protein